MKVKRIRVVAALLREGGRVLIQQRYPGGPRGLLWEFPGGKVEPGETDAEALVRECREELDIGVTVHSLAWSGVHLYPDLEVELLLYRCDRADGEPRPLSANALRFESVERLDSLPFCEADVPLIARLMAGEF